LEPPVGFPEPLSHIWSAFIALNNTRTTGFNGPNPITYTELLAWKEVTQNPLAPWEVEAVKRIDNIYMRVMNSD
jgi:hypothetical protein